MAEIVSIRNCPHCRATHYYKLEVERTILMKWMGSFDTPEQPRTVKVTRLFVCPVKHEQYQGTFYLQDTSSNRIKDVKVIDIAEEAGNDRETPKLEDRTDSIIPTEDVTLVSPTNQAIYAAGKSMLIESIGVGREFCKFMVGTSMSAIPIYLALLKFILPEKYVPTFQVGLLALIPPVLFLIAGVVFLIGYFPQIGTASLDIPEEIEKERKTSVQRRYGFSIRGFIVFAVAVLAALIVMGYTLQIPDRAQQTQIKVTEPAAAPNAEGTPRR